jgi:uncharacterized protein (DUF488 family)
MSKTQILTFGYGNRTNYEELQSYIEKYNVAFLIDVRKKPRGWSTIWSAPKLSDFCESIKISYISKISLGNESGRSDWIPPDLKEAEKALREISKLAKQYNVLLMCAEKDWRKCHRTEVSERLKDKTKGQVLHLD